MIHAKHVIPKSVLITIVQALVTSVVRYCISLYRRPSISDRRKYDHTSDVFRELNWLDARRLVMYHRLCLIHSAITTCRPESVADVIGTSAQHHYQTRGSSQRVLSRIRTEQGRRRLCYSGVREYNQLPFDTNTRGFRSRLRRHLLHVQHGGV